MAVTVINNYNFLEGKSKLFEIRFDDIPRSACKEDRFQWYLIHKDVRYDLIVDVNAAKINDSTKNGLKSLRCGNLEVVLDVTNLMIYLYDHEYEGLCGGSFTEEKYNLI